MERLNRKNKRQKSNVKLDYLREVAKKESHLRQGLVRRNGHGYSADTAHSAASSTAVTYAAAATALSTDETKQPASTITGIH